MAYDNTYALASRGPTLVNLNYAGITQLEFLPQQPGSTYVSDAYIFAMDNLSVTLAPEPGAWALLATGAGLMLAYSWQKRM